MSSYIYLPEDRYKYMVLKSGAKGNKELESFLYLVATNDSLYGQIRENLEVHYKKINSDVLLNNVNEETKAYLEIALSICFNHRVLFEKFLLLSDDEMKNVIRAIKILKGEVYNEF